MTPEKAAELYPHLIRIGEDGVPELYADNHILSHLRLCEAYFVENFLNNLHLKGGRSWSLEFGIWFHKVMEEFYRIQKTCTEDDIDGATTCAQLVDFGSKIWIDLDMQFFVQNPVFYKTCAKIGGLSGGVNLIVDYWRQYGEGRDTLKIIGTELSFGKGKEVPILEQPVPKYNIPFRAYYSGRMDAIGDDGVSIFPVDHKTTSTIGPNTGRDFKPHEGMEGYVYSLSKIAKTFFPTLQRSCNKALVNHVQVQYSSDYTKRFKRTPLNYSPKELEEWRLRQIRTFKLLWQLMVEEESPFWNTSTCHDIYNYPCPFRILHEQDPINRDTYLKAHYVQIEAWDASAIDGLRKVSE